MSSLNSYALTHAQQQIWIGQNLHRNSPLYNMAITCRVRGPLDENYASTAWEYLSIKHPALSTFLDSNHPEPKIVQANKISSLRHIDLSDTVDSAYENALKLVNDETKRCFENKEILTQCWLIKLTENDYLWFIKQHHIITDALSFSAIWNQFIELYEWVADPLSDNESLSNKIESQERALRVLNNTYFEKQLSPPTDPLWNKFWTDQATGVAPVLFGKSQDTTETESLRQRFDFNQTRRDAFAAMCALPDARTLSQHISQSTVLLSVFFALLHRLTNESNLCIAIPSANRETAAHNESTGLFIELLPLTVSVETTDTFNNLLYKVRSAFVDHLKYSRPGACTVANSKRPIAVFNYITASMSSKENSDLDIEWHHNDHADANHVLRLQVTDWLSTNQPELAMDINTSVFSSRQRSDVEVCWWSLFDCFADNSSELIVNADINLHSNVFTKQLKTHQNEPKINPNILLPELIEEQVRAYTGELALSHFGKHTESNQPSLSYGQVAEASDHIASQFITSGLSTGSRIGIALPRSINQVILILGIIKAGACYVPIDRSQPRDRIAMVCHDAVLSALILTNSDLKQAPNDIKRYLLAIEGSCSLTELDGNPLKADKDIALPKINHSDPAYILYTSGSTGKPKGVLVSHGALANYLQWARKYYCDGSRHKFPLFTPITFDLTVTSLFLPLISGGELGVYPEQDINADIGVLDVLSDKWATIIKLTPAHLAMVPERMLTDSAAQQFILGGDDLKQALAIRVHTASNGSIVIHNEYGPTENTVGCIVHTYNPIDDIDASIPIGNPISGNYVRIVNNSNKDQPNGVKGELLLAGESLADGYWNNPSQTTQSFVYLPCQSGNTMRYYRTGDYVRVNDADQIVYLGRIDNQIKLNGIRVETGEVSARALTIDGIEDCIVKLIDHDSTMESPELFCQNCGLSSRYPESELDSNLTCKVCKNFYKNREMTASYFGSMDQLKEIVESVKEQRTGEYDCIVLLSGGKDSSYSLGILVDMGLRVLAFTLDNGYISDQAKANVQRVCKALKVDHEYGMTESMNEIFVDSLNTHSNVCHGCFKVVYTLSLQLAKEKNINAIFTGLSRGQFFETRLTDELFSRKNISIKAIDAAVLDSRKAYHLQEDAVSRHMNVSHVRDSAIFDKIRMIDFYRYCDVNLGEMYRYLEGRLPWIRPDDTGRSTNCLINDVGIYVHKLERGFHNYSLPYSWDVRLGHKERDEALHELDDEIDIDNVNKIINEIGYKPKLEGSVKSPSGLSLYYTIQPGKQVDPQTIKDNLQASLPHWMVPRYFVPMSTMPLNSNGKVDTEFLPIPSQQRDLSNTEYRAPSTESEKILSQIWCNVLKLDRVGIDDNYFDLNGDSLGAILIVNRINEAGYSCEVSTLFEKPTIAKLSNSIKRLDVENESDSSLTLEPFDSLSSDQMLKLSAIMSNSSK